MRRRIKKGFSASCRAPRESRKRGRGHRDDDRAPSLGVWVAKGGNGSFASTPCWADKMASIFGIYLQAQFKKGHASRFHGEYRVNLGRGKTLRQLPKLTQKYANFGGLSPHERHNL